jgi:hypothetical protein
MKNCIKGLYAALLITIAGLSGCENPLNQAPAPDRSGNYGYVAVKIETPHKANASMARTIYPDLSGFTKYELSFSNGPESHAAVVVNPAVNSPIELAVGEWTITATAFIGTEGAYTDVAQGSVTITVNPGQTTESGVTLGPIIGEAGIFSYSIAVPEGATGNLVISTPEGAVVNNGNISLASGSTTSSTMNLPTGQYLMSVSLTLGEKRAGRTEALHIYPYMTSPVEYQFFPYDFQLVTVLSPNEWTEGTLSSGEVHWYKFTASEGSTYQVQWNDCYGDGTKTLSASVSAYTSDSSVIFQNQTYGWINPQTISGQAGTVYLEVQGTSGNNAGIYAIKYYDPSSLPPQAGLELSINVLPGPLAAVSWNSVSVATGYRLYRTTSPNDSTSYRQIANQTGVTYVNTNVFAGITYYYKVCAYNGNGDGPMSAVASVVIPAATGTPLSIKTWANGTISSGGEIQWYTFTASEGVTYQVQWNDYYGDGTKTLPASVSAYTSDGSVIFLEQTSGLTNPRTVAGVTGTVYLKVRGEESDAVGSFAVVYFNSALIPVTPAAPVINLGSTQFTVSWATVIGASAYEVWMGSEDNSALASKRGDDVTGTSAIISGLDNDTMYYVWIKAKNAAGTSGFSGRAVAKPIADTGTPVVIAGVSELLVSWDTVTGADEYEVYCGTDADPTTLNTTVSDTTATITGLTNETLYYVRLRAKNATGVAAYSETVSATPVIVGLYDGVIDTAHRIGSQNLVDSANYLSSNAVTGHDYFIVLGTDGSGSNINLSYSGETIGITLMGFGAERTINLNANTTLFTIGTGVTLTLDTNITLRGGTGNTNSLVSVGSGGVLIMEGGSKISGNRASSGGGVSVASAGTFIMNGGEISGNTTSSSSSCYGGGVYIYGGTFIMNGGEISGNTTSSSSSSCYGGGVYIYGGTFTMSGGEISGNTISSYAYYGYSHGGGVYVASGTFTMSGGEISGNTISSSYSYSHGGGVSVASAGTFTMSGGEISGNTASSYFYGGGVYNAGTFTMSGGEISGHTASYGGGVYTEGTFKKTPATGSSTSGIIYGDTDTIHTAGSTENTADTNGHAVYVNSSPVDKRNSTAGTGVTLDSSIAGSAGGWE